MAQRPCLDGRRTCRNCVPSTEQWVPRKPHSRRQTVYGIYNKEPISLQRSRARLINQLTHPDDEKDVFEPPDDSQNQTPPNYTTFSVPSHTSNIFRSRPKRNVVPTYPLQSLRWNPYVETASIEDYKNDYYDDSPEKCSCDSCVMRRRLAKNETRGFRDNIMQFVDQCTMTPRLTDSSCGGRDVVPRTRESQISIPGSDYVSRDPVANMHTDSCYVRKFPAPILKKSAKPITREFYNGFNFEDYYTDDYDMHDDSCEDVKDTRIHKHDRINTMKSSQIKFCDSLKSSSFNYDRKMIYNEGISDKIANRYPMMPMAVPAPVRKNSSKVSTEVSRATPVYAEDECPRIPYSHRSDSRYHQCCKVPESRVYHGQEEDRQLVGGSPGLVLRVPPRVATRCKTPPSKLPKRVLTSDRDIEAYIETSHPKIPVPPLSARNKPSVSLFRS